jgi:hypothetical protein
LAVIASSGEEFSFSNVMVAAGSPTTTQPQRQPYSPGDVSHALTRSHHPTWFMLLLVESSQRCRLHHPRRRTLDGGE